MHLESISPLIGLLVGQQSFLNTSPCQAAGGAADDAGGAAARWKEAGASGEECLALSQPIAHALGSLKHAVRCCGRCLQAPAKRRVIFCVLHVKVGLHACTIDNKGLHACMLMLPRPHGAVK